MVMNKYIENIKKLYLYMNNYIYSALITEITYAQS